MTRNDGRRRKKTPGWVECHALWREQMGAYYEQLTRPFTMIELHGGSSFVPPAEGIDPWQFLFWWPQKKLQEYRETCQEQILRCGGTTVLNPMRSQAGLESTLQMLWQCRRSPERVSATLIAASIFMHFLVYRGPTLVPVPGETTPRAVTSLFYEACSVSHTHTRWEGNNTRVLPKVPLNAEYRYKGMRGLVEYMAEEHREILSRFCLVAVRVRGGRYKRRITIKGWAH